MSASTAFAHFASVSSSLMAVLSSEGVVEEANPAFHGFVPTGDVARSKPFAQLVHSDDRAAVTELLRRLEVGASIEFRARLDRPLGTDRIQFAQFEATRASEEAIYVVGIPSASMATSAGEAETTSDARAKLVEHQLAELERHLATVELLPHALRLAPVILWASDAQGWGTHLEGGALPKVGLDGDTDPSTINIFEIFAERPELLEALRRTLTGETVKHEATFGTATFDTWFVPSRDEQGDVSGFIGLFVDITQRVKSAGELREKLEYIERQTATIRALATPILQVWKHVLCLPVIGIVDSGRAAQMMDTLLEAIAQQGPRYAVIDLTGVELVDTSTAELILRLFGAAKLMGTEGILCGIRPAVAQTITGLGLDLRDIRTMRSLQHALEWCIATDDASDEDSFA